MRYHSSLLLLAAPLAAYAAPVKRASSANDLLVFQFADVLNQLEMNFYQQGMAKFQSADFQAAGFMSDQVVTQQLNRIMQDEMTHISTIQSAIKSFGGSLVQGCQFDLSPALTDLPTMTAVARIFEMVGVSAFLGAAPLLDDPVLLDAAASVMTVEARHSTMLNVFNTGSAIPSAFDIPLTPSEILAMAGPFISGCDLGVKANPSLMVTNSGPITPGVSLTFKSSALNGTTDGLFCQMLIGGMPTSIPFPIDQCTVPSGINGPVAIWITSDGQPLANNVVNRATSQLVAGPMYLFVDSATETLSQMVRTGSKSNSASTTVRTITPEQANSIMAAAKSSPTA